MALVATVGASTANAYDTYANSATYFADGIHPKADTWLALTEPDASGYLIQATRQIDALKINGNKYTTTATSGVPDQALKFPRGCDYDDGSTFIPVEVKHAMFEQAVYLAESGDAAENRADLQRQGVKSFTLGDLSETYGSSKGNVLCSLAYNMLLKAGMIRVTATIEP